MRRASTDTIISALRILAVDIVSDDGVANAALGEAAERMAELQDLLKRASGQMSHERWGTAFRRAVERAL